ncbi:hypothetical protein NPIL_250271 [Nephila pilipes]|uniref:Uncharacterized protein n=1 Tax=Nephila pilipes TaxID=299642 RepID=A0A8X6NI31_NEPPI|nr:hypothetical protein NPIL_250271 [Nephila pilipes]
MDTNARRRIRRARAKALEAELFKALENLTEIHEEEDHEIYKRKQVEDRKEYMKRRREIKKLKKSSALILKKLKSQKLL